MNKHDKLVEKQLDHLDKFAYIKKYQEFDSEIPHLEGRIPIFYQYLKYPFVIPSSFTKKSTPHLQLDDMIERFTGLNLEQNGAPPTKQLGPSQ